MHYFFIVLLLPGLLLVTPLKAESLGRTLEATRVIDLTHPLYEGMPYWPGTEPIKIKRLADYEQGYRMHKFSMWENIGTHVDSPSHFAAGKGKRSIDQLSPRQLIVPMLVIDLREKAAADADYALEVADIYRWEAEHGPVEKDSLVIMNTGWHKKFSDPKSYVNQDEQGVLHFPGFSVAAARLLLERGVAGIGIDTMSLDPGKESGFPVHNVMLGANRFQVENMNNLDLLPAKGATAVIGVLPVRDGSQAQARIFGLIK